jgi:hypothetical protein
VELAELEQVQNKTYNMDFRSNNLIYDSLFQSDLGVNGNTTLAQSKFYWWDEVIVGSGTVKKQIASVITNGTKNGSIVISTGATGLGTELDQTLYFHNYAELDLLKDLLSFGVWIRQTVANSAQLTIEFLDRNLAVGVNIPLTQSQFSVTSGADVNKWVQLKLENIQIPNGSFINSIAYEPSVAVRIRLKNLVNNSTVEFSEPMANIGASVNEFQPRVMDWSVYNGLEEVAYKLYRKQNILINVFGDSISAQSLTSDTDSTGNPSYSVSFKQFIDSKFGVTSTIQHRVAAGSAFTNSLLLWNRSAIANKPDLAIISHGRNVSSQAYNGTVSDNLPIIESLVRRLKNASPSTNIVISLPFHKLLVSGSGATEQELIYDKQLLDIERQVASFYGCAQTFNAEKVRIAGEKGLAWAIYQGNNLAGTDRTHPFRVGHIYYAQELKHILWGSYLNTRSKPMMPSAYMDASVQPMTQALEAATSLFPSQYSVPGSYQDGTSGMVVTVNSVNGTWSTDPNFDSTQLTTNKKLIGVSGFANVAGFGPYELPMVSSNQGDYIDLSWNGKYFMIFFAPASNRGNAKITINGTVYTFNTFDSSLITKHVYPTFTNCITGANPSSLSALPSGTNNIRIEQKDAVANSQISIVGIILF